MAEDLFENTNLKVYENNEMLYHSYKEKTIQKLNIIGNRIEKLMNLDEDTLKNSESIKLLLEIIRNLYTELLLLKDDIEKLKTMSS
jgi:hypothetical protein